MNLAPGQLNLVKRIQNLFLYVFARRSAAAELRGIRQGGHPLTLFKSMQALFWPAPGGLTIVLASPRFG